MQVEMERGGRLFFDLFVAMCNHMVSLGNTRGYFDVWDGFVVYANFWGVVG